MKSLNTHFPAIFILIVFALIMAGCGAGTPQATFYTLSTIQDGDAMEQPISDYPDVAIGIGPVKFPDNLDRPSIVTRIDNNRLKIDELHRWGGSLEKKFKAVLVENVAYLLQTDQVVARPWERYFKPDIRITIDVHRFSGDLGKQATLRATWMIFTSGAKVPLVIKTSNIIERSEDESYGGLVAAQSRSVAVLCAEIAQAVDQVLKNQ
ncbi:MAG: membrane integrity-associated transporter subunit PqiC [Desulfobulbaceae bacterium]|nr:MAG: membrane integrity-associated transporter subunit PqiC [Desulfobulbaceae bacterium]